MPVHDTYLAQRRAIAEGALCAIRTILADPEQLAEPGVTRRAASYAQRMKSRSDSWWESNFDEAVAQARTVLAELRAAVEAGLDAGRSDETDQ